MTHNIVAQFSSSLNTNGTFKEYPVVVGSVFNEEYSETLDSATIILSQVAENDRLTNIKPYDFVRVFDKSTNYNPLTGKYEFDHVYLLDSFEEKENNINENIYGYTINLMSQTKFLEKIQCPNLMVSHEVKDGVIHKKTIIKKINEYMELFIPKIKFSSGDGIWSYEPLIKFDAIRNLVGTATTFLSESDYINNNPYRRQYTQDINKNYDRSVSEYSFETDLSGIATSFDSIGRKLVGIVINDITCDDSDYISKEAYMDSNWVLHFNGTRTPSAQGMDTTHFSFDLTLLGGDLGKVSVPFEIKKIIYLPSNVDTNKIEKIKLSFSGDLTFSNAYVEIGSEDRILTFHGLNDYYYGIYPNVRTSTTTIIYEYFSIVDSKWNKFDVPCADLPFNVPTLRQLLTTLMQQVGCIPVVKDRNLSFLDFQLNAIPFNAPANTINYIRRGLSSDSYVNSLVNISNNVLDSENEVVCETLGFRNYSEDLLKQQGGLKLETKLPIYKVNNLILNFLGTAYVSFPSINKTRLGDGTLSSNFWECHLKDYVTDNKYDDVIRNYNSNKLLRMENPVDDIANCVLSITRDAPESGNNDTIEIKIRCYPMYLSNSKFHAYRVNDNRYYRTHSGTISDTSADNDNETYTVTSSSDLFNIFFNRGTGANADNAFVIVEIIFHYETINGEQKTVSGMKFVDSTFSTTKRTTSAFKIDITPLLVEQSIRGMLDNNFNKMVSNYEAGKINTLEDLAKYVYGTIGYSIGSNSISGFSEIYTVGHTTALGWIDTSKTYIENIMNFIQSKSLFRYDEEELSDLIGQNKKYDIPYVEEDIENIYGIKNNFFQIQHPTLFTPTGIINFVTLTFNIKYQPLNSFNMSYVKTVEDIDVPLEQFDSNASGITDFDRLSIHEQEQVDRIGNETLTINQRTINYNDIQKFNNGPLKYNRDSISYIVFKRSFTINNNFFNASYIASKDAVLKDYFTSIRTKYRAYQYVDYSQSILRKEKDIVYVRIAKNYYDGDDKIWFGNLSTTRANSIKGVYNLISNIGGLSRKKLTYVCENGTNSNGAIETTKNDLSIITTSKTMALIYEQADNTGSGTYIANDDFDTSNDWNYKIGGVPQSWQIWDTETYNVAHYVCYTTYIDFYEFEDTTNPSKILELSETAMRFIIKDVVYPRLALSPIVEEEIFDIQTGDNVNLLVTSNNKGDLTRTFYKDVAERINHTVEFIYYNPNNDFIFGELFIRSCPFLLNENSTIFPNCMTTDDPGYELKEEPHEEYSIIDNITDYVELKTDGPVPYLLVKWGNSSSLGFKICNKIKRTGFYTLVRDIAILRRSSLEETESKFYFVLNDTKTDYVMSEKNGILYRRYTVKNSNENNFEMYVRKTTPIYSE